MKSQTGVKQKEQEHRKNGDETPETGRRRVESVSEQKHGSKCGRCNEYVQKLLERRKSRISGKKRSTKPKMLQAIGDKDRGTETPLGINCTGTCRQAQNLPLSVNNSVK